MEPYDDPRRGPFGPSGYSQPVMVGDVLTLEVEQLGLDGDGLCRVNNYVVFVPGVLEGEMVEVEIVSAGRKHGRGILRRIDTPSPARVEPRCPHYGECGGCQLQHLAYDAQLDFKTAVVRARLQHVLEREAVPVRRCLGPAEPWGHRTRIALQIIDRYGLPVAGLYRRRSKQVIDIHECPVSDPDGWRVAVAAVDAARRVGIEAYDPRSGSGTLRTVLTRTTSAGETAATMVLRSKNRAEISALSRQDFGASSVAININDEDHRMLGRHTEMIAGRDSVDEEVAGTKFRLPPTAWFRTSRFAVETVVETVRQLVEPLPDATVVDLYAGMGLFGLTLARHVGKVIGIEDNPNAVADAYASRKLNGLTNIEFRRGTAEQLLGEIRDKVYALVLDPPPDGCGRFVINAITKDLRPERIIYVSQNLDSFADEVATIAGRGYNLTVVQPIDHAPHTGGIEVVALFEGRIVKGKRGSSIAQARRLLQRVRGESRQPREDAPREPGDSQPRPPTDPPKARP